MRGEQRLEYRFLVDHLRAALEHHDRIRLGRDHHRDVALLELLGGRIGDQLAVDPAHPHRRDRPVVRDVGDFQRGRSRDQREHVGIVVAVGREHRDDDLGFLVVALGKQRAHRAVDQPRGQDFFFRGTALALKKAAGDFAGGEGLFLVVDGQRQEVDIGSRLVGRHDGREHYRLAILGQHGAMGLLGQPAGLQRQLAAGKINLEFSIHLDSHLREDGGPLCSRHDGAQTTHTLSQRSRRPGPAHPHRAAARLEACSAYLRMPSLSISPR